MTPGPRPIRTSIAHVRKLRSQPPDEGWNAEYARLLGAYAEADRAFREYDRTHWTGPGAYPGKSETVTVGALVAAPPGR